MLAREMLPVILTVHQFLLYPGWNSEAVGLHGCLADGSKAGTLIGLYLAEPVECGLFTINKEALEGFLCFDKLNVLDWLE